MKNPWSTRRWRSLVFDCDGVLLDSNRVKTEAFRQVARQFGEAAADALVSYHVANGGISRYRKFEYLLSTLLGQPASEGRVAKLADAYGERVTHGLLSCAVAQGLDDLRAQTAAATWMVVSGGAQAELRAVFRARGLATLFDGGIFGCPDSKETILSAQLALGRLQHPSVFFGDSRYDHEAASRAGLDFVFVSGWTEFQGWHEYCHAHGITSITALRELLDRLPFDTAP